MAVRLLTWLAPLALILLALQPARADPEPAATLADEVLVKEGFRTAEALRAEGNLTGALSVLRMTYARVATPFLLWPMAELCVALQRPQEGLRALREYAEKLPPPEKPDPGQPSKADVERLLGRLEGQLAQLTLAAGGAGALVLVDGRQIGRTPLPGPLLLDPGRHEIELRPGARQALRRDPAVVVLAPGQRRTLSLEAPAPRRGRDPAVLARWAIVGLGVGAMVTGGALLGEDAACQAAGACLIDTRTPGAALLGAGAGLLGGAALLVGLEVRRRGGGARGLRATLGWF